MKAEVGKRVLVIDDSPDVRRVLRTILGAHGYTVTSAATAAEGIAAALTTRPDLVIVDLCLRDDDGLAVARAIRSEASLAHVPILVMSAYDSAQFRVEAVEAGCAGYTAKPFDLERLLKTVLDLTGS